MGKMDGRGERRVGRIKDEGIEGDLRPQTHTEAPSSQHFFLMFFFQVKCHMRPSWSPDAA